MKQLIILTTCLLAQALTVNAQSLRLTVPAALPRGYPLGEFSPLIKIQYEGLTANAGPWTLKVWLLEQQTHRYEIASSQWEPRIFTLKNTDTTSGELLIVSEMDVYSYSEPFLFVCRLYDRAGTEVASAKAISKSVSQAPAILKPIGKRVTAVGNRLEFKLASDAPKDAKVRYRMTGAPSDASLDPTGVFSWTPTSAGTFTVVFEVVLDEIADAEVVKIEIEKPSQTTANP